MTDILLSSLKIERQKALEEYGYGRRIPVFVPLKWVLTPPQVRKWVEPNYIHDLAQSIVASRGFENPPIVWANTKEGFRRYHKLVQQSFNDKSTRVSQFFSVGSAEAITILNDVECDGYTYKDFYPKAIDLSATSFYFPVVAGACRTKACRHLWDFGCDACQAEFGKEPEGACFRRHFGSDLIKVQLSIGDEPEEMLSDMFHENRHKEPDRRDLAEGLAGYYRFYCITHPEKKVTFTAFCQQLGSVSTDQLRESLRWINLPKYIKTMVDENKLSFPIAIQLARLQEEGFSDGDIRNCIATIHGLKIVTVARATELISKMISVARSDKKIAGGADLVTMMQRSQVNVAERMRHRKVIEPKLLMAAYGFLEYLFKINALYTDGILGTNDSIYSEASVRTVLLKLFDRARETTRLTRALSKAEKRSGIHALDSVIAALDELNKD